MARRAIPMIAGLMYITFSFFKVVILQLPVQRGSTTPTYYNTKFHCNHWVLVLPRPELL